MPACLVTAAAAAAWPRGSARRTLGDAPSRSAARFDEAKAAGEASCCQRRPSSDEWSLMAPDPASWTYDELRDETTATLALDASAVGVSAVGIVLRVTFPGQALMAPLRSLQLGLHASGGPRGGLTPPAQVDIITDGGTLRLTPNAYDKIDEFASEPFAEFTLINWQIGRLRDATRVVGHVAGHVFELKGGQLRLVRQFLASVAPR